MSGMTTQRVYFAYGSNLSLTQMTFRCPGSTMIGIALLRDWTWIINTRGYANVIQNPSSTSEPTSLPSSSKAQPPSVAPTEASLSTTASKPQNNDPFSASSSADHVFGLLYLLSPNDEKLLDGFEGVPEAYGKEILSVEFWAADSVPEGGEKGFLDRKQKAKKVNALVYVDRKQLEVGEPKEEYIGRIARGIKEAGEKGFPVEWARRVMGSRYFGDDEEEEEEDDEDDDDEVSE